MEEKQELKLMKKSQSLIEKLRQNDMDFNDLFILECFYFQDDREFLNIYNIPSFKDFNISNRFQFLKKNEFLVEDPGDTSKIIISVKGINFVENLITKRPDPTDLGNGCSAQIVILDVSKPPEECFEEWWKAYPTSPAWKSDDGNTTFTGSRVLRNLRKADAKKRYLKLLNQGLSHEDLLGSLKYEVKIKKMDSIKKNANQMEYFKGMESYFNQERYLIHIEDFKKDPSFVLGEDKIKSRRRNVTDI